MRNLLTLSAAASVLAIGITAQHAAALSPGARRANPEAPVVKVQKSEEKGAGTRDAAGKSGEPGARGQDGAGKGASPGATQQTGSDRGTQRSGDKQRSDVDVRGSRGERDRADRRTRVDVDVDGARRGYRADRRTRVDVDVERRRRSGGGDIGVNVRGFGYTPMGCQDLLRRYRQCIAR